MIERPEVLFCDSEGFPIVGARCSLDICREHDFLPVRCRHCQANFCRAHAEPAEHSCEKTAAAGGMQAVVCALCEETVRWDAACTTEEASLDAHRSCCRGKPQAKDRCPAPNCQEVLGLLNTMECPFCRQKVCLAHRFEDAHPCRKILSSVGGEHFHRKELAAPARNVFSPSPDSTPTSASGLAVHATTRKPLASPQELRDLRRALGGSTASRDACLCAVRRALSDVSRDPENLQLRSLQRSHEAVRERVLGVPGAEELLLGIGFEDRGPGLELPRTVGRGRIDVVMRILV
mmetsp:Transcript_88134/g.174907  ORF Transcript_88134/g.174907 Transcript_88134/m.174907 type:complete len:291 (-) Transcript_88134:92-964(-)